MKVVFLNTWNGKIRDGITKFIEKHRDDTDVFCFQEVYESMQPFFDRLLLDYKKVTAYKYIQKDDYFLQATYVGGNAALLSTEILFEDDMSLGLGIYTQIKCSNKVTNIGNFHGLSKPGEKLDNPDRLRQSQGLIDFFKDKKGVNIIGGDFNILPETESVKMFKKNGYRDLISDFNISNTRNRFAWENYPDSKQYHFNYIFLDSSVKIKSFVVPDIEISDHLPLILDIKL